MQFEVNGTPPQETKGIYTLEYCGCLSLKQILCSHSQPPCLILLLLDHPLMKARTFDGEIC